MVGLVRACLELSPLTPVLCATQWGVCHPSSAVLSPPAAPSVCRVWAPGLPRRVAPDGLPRRRGWCQMGGGYLRASSFIRLV